MSEQSLRPGLKLSEYVLVERIGSGGFGEVWSARHAEIAGRFVAIKVPSDRAFTRELRAEAFLQSALVHPNIVRTLGLNTQHDPPFFVMELVEGISLRDLIRKKKRLPPAQAARVASQTLEALQFAHDRGVVHRDVKPGNIICGTDGRVRVTDFGLSHVSDGTQSAMRHSGGVRGVPPKMVPGTALYMAPEQRRGQAVDGRADVYAVGVVLFEVLTGELPSGCDLPSEMNPRVPPELDAITKRALKSEAGQRYASAAAMKADLEAFLRGEAPSAHPVGNWAGRGQQRWLAASAIATVAVAALGLAGPILMKTRSAKRGAEPAQAGMGTIAVDVTPGTSTAQAGRVVLRTVPEGAEVFVDGESRGLSPATLETLRAGKHTVSFRLRDHADLSQEFNVGPGETLAPTYRLEALIGGLSLAIEPNGAHVWIDGKDYGTASPVLDVRNLPAGRHAVRIEMPNFRSRELDIDVEGGRVTERHFKLDAIGFGGLLLESDPPGAQVFVDGKLAGTTGKPLTVERLKEGQVKVTFLQEGYEPSEINLDVTAGDVMPHNAVLVPKPSSLDLAVPAGAAIWVDGERRGSGPQALAGLKPGEHVVRVFDVERTVAIFPGKSSTLKVTLEELGLAKIAGGETTIGADDAFPDSAPAHRVRLSTFAMDRYEVTVRQYRRFLADVVAKGDDAWRHPDQPRGKAHEPAGWGRPGTTTEELPVVGVDWFDAYAYAKWAGKRLPTESEWERAARGPAGTAWPWGGEAPNAGTSVRANLGGRDTGAGSLTAVGGHPTGASIEGVQDLIGNAWEWCADWYAKDAYASTSVDNPQGPAGGRSRVVRGGSFAPHPYEVRAFDRAGGDAVIDPQRTIGFRCVADMEK